MDYYSSIARGYSELYGEEQLKKVKIIIKELKIKDEKVLDIACGPALYSKLFKYYAGIDSSKGLLKQTTANVIFGKAEKLPFKNKSFDVVICVTAIHNFDDPKKEEKDEKAEKAEPVKAEPAKEEKEAVGVDAAVAELSKQKEALEIRLKTTERTAAQRQADQQRQEGVEPDEHFEGGHAGIRHGYVLSFSNFVTHTM